MLVFRLAVWYCILRPVIKRLAWPAAGQPRSHIAEMNLELSDDEPAVLTRELVVEI
jgi:hypothetical protein